jgi:cytoskeletal protein CcmA (bactofilin family)
MKGDNPTPPRNDSLVSRNTVIEGDIRGAEGLTIEGTVKGHLHIDGRVWVAESGRVEADIEAKSVVVRGRVKGDVTAENELDIHPGGELYGLIRARLIHIREGAIFEGRSQMIRAAAVESEPAPEAATGNPSNADSLLSAQPDGVKG